MEMQQVDLGFTKFEVTRQAIVMFVFVTILVFLMAIVSTVILYKMGLIGNGALIGFGLLYAVIAILYGIFGAYAINCMVVGKCIKLSWIFPGLYAFATVIYFMVFISTIMRDTPRLPQSAISKVMSKNIKSR